MRITHNLMNRAALSHLQSNLRQVAVAQQQVSSGLRLQKVSDDPVAGAGTMQAGSSLRALEQYRRNVGAAQARTDSEEVVLDQLSELLARAKELAMGEAGSTSSEGTRAAVQAEIKQLLQQAIQLGNTKHAGSYLFGGNHADSAPVAWPDEAAAPVVNPDVLAGQGQRTEIAAGQMFRAGHNAAEIFGDDSPVGALWALYDALGQGSDEVRATLPALDRAFQHVQSLTGEIGAWSNQLRVTTANLDALEITLRTFKADLEEVDLERAITELVSRQTAYQAAMLVTSRVMGMTLADYLR